MNLPKAISEATFTVFGVQLRCYVLDDGRRIIDADDVERLLTRMADHTAPHVQAPDLSELARWMKGR